MKKNSTGKTKRLRFNSFNLNSWKKKKEVLTEYLREGESIKLNKKFAKVLVALYFS